METRDSDKGSAGRSGALLDFGASMFAEHRVVVRERFRETVHEWPT